jgi:phospholipid/cholesterol/gamma-HCH transport system substrate-binding protein
MLRLNRRTWIQLSILTLVTVVSCGAMAFNFMKLPATLFGIGSTTSQSPAAVGQALQIVPIAAPTWVGPSRSMSLLPGCVRF